MLLAHTVTDQLSRFAGIFYTPTGTCSRLLMHILKLRARRITHKNSRSMSKQMRITEKNIQGSILRQKTTDKRRNGTKLAHTALRHDSLLLVTIWTSSQTTMMTTENTAKQSQMDVL